MSCDINLFGLIAVTCVSFSLCVVIEQVDKEHAGERRRRTTRVRKSQYDVRSVDEITKEDLDNIAYRSKDKIWDKENVSHIRTLVVLVLDCTRRSGFLLG